MTIQAAPSRTSRLLGDRIALSARLLLLLAVVIPVPGMATPAATSAEMGRKDRWLKQHFLAGHGPLPFSFTCDGQPSAKLLPVWERKTRKRKLDSQRIEHLLVWTDPKSGLALRCRAVEYRDFPVVEWTLYFTNTGPADTPILADIQSLDVEFQRESSQEFVLHHHTGDNCTPDSYAPHQTALAAGSKQRFAPAGGRPTTGAFPFFNLAYDGGGTIAVLGWPGQWAAQFVRDEARALRISGGQELTRFKLRPGEEVRSPLSVLLFWQGDRVRSQNLWRRWMIAHNLPRPGSKVVPTHYGGCFGNPQPRAEEEIAQIDGWLKEGIKLDYWFIDAGWYPGRGQWANVGTWEVDTTRFPLGLREVADHCHERQIKFIAWFEPERVAPGSWLAANRPEWILGGKSGGLLNLGNPEAWKWVLARVDGLLTSERIDVYRQDFNIEPLKYWRNNDTPDRQGITEIRHVTGYLAFWDELLRRHPTLYIDTCASGGRRNDLETLRRAVPLLRSDYPVSDFTPRGANGQQGQTFGLSLWVPYHGTGAPLSDPYTMRSAFVPAYRLGWDTRNQNIDHALLRRTVDDFRRVENYLLGDFYPLTPYSLAEDSWMAWQLDRPEVGEGVIQAFRREKSQDETMILRLHGLDPRAVYLVKDLDREAATRMPGRELMEKGLPVILEPRQSAVICYRRAKTGAGR